MKILLIDLLENGHRSRGLYPRVLLALTSALTVAATGPTWRPRLSWLGRRLLQRVIIILQQMQREDTNFDIGDISPQIVSETDFVGQQQSVIRNISTTTKPEILQ